MYRLISAIFASLLITAFNINACHGVTEVGVGVLANRGEKRCLEQWQATADYLSQAIPAYHFSIIPLAFEHIDSAIENKKIEFILANSSIYVDLELRHNATRIATLKILVQGKGFTSFGGVIFTRLNSSIKSIPDLAGKRFAAVDQTSFGGWLMALLELRNALPKGEDSLRELEFTGTHDSVVMAVLNGMVDAGTVRTDTLERMAAENKIDLHDICVLRGKGYKHVESFPFLLSTQLYPEWPMATLAHTPDELSRKVAGALFAMPFDSLAAQNAQIEGWTIPSNYESVHELLRALHVKPYADYGKVTFKEAIRQHWVSFLPLFLLLLVLLSSALILRNYNKRLTVTVGRLRKSEETTRAISEASQDSIIMIDDQGLIRFWNASSEKLFGYSQEEMFGRKLHSLVVPKEKLAKVDQNFTEFSRSGNGAMIGIVDEGEALRKDGSTFLAEVTVAKFFHQDRWYSVGTVRDISKRKSDEKRLQELACTDELTKIMNRRRFFELGLTEVQRSRRTGQSASCIMFDVDHFKRINDTYGHNAGDAVLKLLARTTSSTLREIDIFARIGGEEFAVILPETDITSALLVAERLRKRIADMCLMHSDTAISVTISMGVSQLKEQESFDDLLKRSDEALYAAKTSGRNRVINS